MGQKFRAARERKRINVSRAAALTRIKLQHIECMENDDFSKMPAPTYAKGFIRIYAELLGLDAAPLVQEYIDRHQNPPEEEPSRGRPATSRPDDTTRENERTIAVKTKPRIGAGPLLQKALALVMPYLPRLAAAAVVIFLVIGIARCASRLGGSSQDAGAGSMLLNGQAIMKEPPIRYLDLPVVDEEETP